MDKTVMHVIARPIFSDAAKKFPHQAAAIQNAYAVLRKGEFRTPEELKKIFPSLDRFKYRKKWWIIDLGGNHLRLMAFVEFRDNRMYVKHIVTHAEYDKLCEKYAREGD